MKKAGNKVLLFVKSSEVLRSLYVICGGMLVTSGFLNISLIVASMGNQTLANAIMTVSFTITCLIIIDMID